MRSLKMLVNRLTGQAMSGQLNLLYGATSRNSRSRLKQITTDPYPSA
jgi:hypothetical protein